MKAETSTSSEQLAINAPFKGEVLGFFPIPVAKCNLSKYSVFNTAATQLKSTKLKTHNQISSKKLAHAFSQENYLLEKEEFFNIKNIITEKCTQYLNQVLNFEGMAKVTQSWVNCNAPGDITHTHNHPNSVVSGVLYLETDSINGNITFYKHAQDNGAGHSYSLLPSIIDKPINPSFFKAFATTQHTVNVVPGDLVLFPSYLLHSVPVNNSATDRWSLAFNSIPTPRLGASEHLTELKLN